MPEYRRRLEPGATFFFTATLQDRRSNMLVSEIVTLRRAIQHVQVSRPFTIDAAVILPDHLHMVWSLPSGDADYSTRLRLIKHAFSTRVEAGAAPAGSKSRKGEKGIWQRRFYEHTIRDEDDYVTHVDYVHFNPVKHGYVSRPIDWPHSSIHRFVAKGILSRDWGTSDVVPKFPGEFGE
jgi:putative transposase